MRRLKRIFRKLRPARLPAADVTQFEIIARDRLPPTIYEYIRSGAADEITISRNREAFARLSLLPRALVDVSAIDTTVSLLGNRLEAPFMLAPIAYHRLYHPEGELATARGADAAGAAMIVSSFTTTPLPEIARNTRQPLWFQLYVQRDRAFTRDMIQRAVDSGCKAICLTVDSPVLGARYGQIDFGLPAGIECVELRGLPADKALQKRDPHVNIYDHLFEPALAWRDLDWLRSVSGVPLVVKGMLNPDDASRAVDAGVDAIVVSNHGGRNLDKLPATIDVLPHIVEAVENRIPVLMDGGIRRGTDILMALARGAKAVLIGRPYAYGLAAGGAAGVERVLRILRDEFQRAMALTGRRSVSEIDASVLWREEQPSRPRAASTLRS